MSEVNSWIQLHIDQDELQLSKKLRGEDEFLGVDVGWVSQMRPFIREFSKPGDLILDPFCGAGTTLIAAELEKRKSLGIEIEESRVELIEKRWHECGFNEKSLSIHLGDCVSTL